MPRALSNTRLEDQVPQAEQYGENLNVPGGGANNPFLQQEQTENYSYTADGRRIEANQDQYYGAGYSQAQSGYSSSGFGTFSLIFHTTITKILISICRFTMKNEQTKLKMKLLRGA